MCIPLAVASLAVSVAGAGMSAYGQVKGAKAAKKQAKLAAANATEQAALSEFNATEIERVGKLNRDLVLATSSLNNRLTAATTSANLDLINTTSDFNLTINRANTEFNISSAEGAARFIEARGQAEADLRNQNADVAEIQAQDAYEAGNQAERQTRAGYARLKGAQRSRLAANGVELGEGSALRILADTDYAADVDADVIRSNTMKAVFGYRVSAAQERAEGAFASIDAQAQGASKRTEALAAKLNGMSNEAQIRLERDTRAADLKMSTSVQMLQESTNAAIEALNISENTKSDAWAARAQAKGYQGQAAQSRLTAKSINPALIGATSLVNSAASIASSWYSFRQSGALTSNSRRVVGQRQYDI